MAQPDFKKVKKLKPERVVEKEDNKSSTDGDSELEEDTKTFVSDNMDSFGFAKQSEEINSSESHQKPQAPKKTDSTSIISNRMEADILYYIKRKYPELLKEYNDFFYKEQRALPLINGKISLFGLFIIKQFLDCIFQKEALKEKYDIQIKLDNVRAPASMQKMWDVASKSIDGYIASKDFGPIYFTNKEAASKGYLIVASALAGAKNKMWKTKQLPSKLKEDSVVPFSMENYFNFPFFAFDKENDILTKLNDLEDLIKNGVVKTIKFDSMKKKNWESFFLNLYYEALDSLTTNEKEQFDFQKPKEIFTRFSNINNVSKFNFLVVNDFKKNLKKVSKSQKEILKIIYYSWVRLLITPQSQKNIIEEYSFNMYSFVSNTWIYSKKSPYLFKPEFFIDYVPYVRDLPNMKWNQVEMNVLLKNLYVHKNKNSPLSIRQLDMILLGKYTWTNINFVLRNIVSLIKNNFLFIEENSIYLAPELEIYFDLLKSDKYKQLFDKIQDVINTYFTINPDYLIIKEKSKSVSKKESLLSKEKFYTINVKDNKFYIGELEIPKEAIIKNLINGAKIKLEESFIKLTDDQTDFEIVSDEISELPDQPKEENDIDFSSETNISSANIEQTDKKIKSMLAQMSKINHTKLGKKQ